MKANHADIERLLKTARGQMDGLLRMVDDDRYCIDIVNQIQATRALLAMVQNKILIAHLDGCVRTAFQEGTEDEQHEKLTEIQTLFAKLL